METLLEGPIIPTITPLFNGKIDLESAARLYDNILSSECGGVFPLGTTGEDRHIPIGEKKRLISFVGKSYTGKTAVLVGTSGETLEETVFLTRFAAENGIDTVVLTPLYRSWIDPVEYVSIAVDGTNLNVVVYNNPAKTNGRNLSLRQLSDLANMPGVIAMKESSSNMEYFGEVSPLASDSFRLFPGTQSKLEQAFAIASVVHGFIPSVGNTYPELVVDLWRHRRPEDFERLRQATNQYKGLSPVQVEKALAYEMGLIKSPEIAKNGRH